MFQLSDVLDLFFFKTPRNTIYNLLLYLVPTLSNVLQTRRGFCIKHFIIMLVNHWLYSIFISLQKVIPKVIIQRIIRDTARCATTRLSQMKFFKFLWHVGPMRANKAIQHS